MTDPKTLARTKNPQTSKDAAKKMVKSGALDKQSFWIYGHIKEYIMYRVFAGQSSDFTTKDIAAYISCFACPISKDKIYEICRRRFSDLEMKNKIELVKIINPSGKWIDEHGNYYDYKRRDGCRVWRLK